MEREILGSVYYKTSEEFMRGIYPIVRTVKAEQHDLAVVEMEERRLGNIYGEQFGTGYAGNVWDSDGISPALMTMQGGGRQPMIVAMRGRNPDNPSDRTAGSPTEQRLEPNSQGICNTLTSVQKDNMVLESAVLTPKRTEYGKAIRKAYESGKIEESRHNMTELEARKDGMSNTLTTVQKDNLLLERSNMNVQWRIRKLTPLECWRLMSFSDEDFLSAKLGSRQATKETLAKYPHLGKRAFNEMQRIEKMSNSQLYKQAGNSIVKNVLMAIFAQLIKKNGGLT